MQGFDIIGDIHGCGRTLAALLEKMDYAAGADGNYRHAKRQAIFIGDFIDRGPHQREVINIVRGMIDAGAAQAVMGNHEFNAIAYATPDPEGDGYLRPHSDKNRKQHQVFLDAYAGDEAGYREAIEWFKTLPLWLDLGGIKVIHACWDKQHITKVSDYRHGRITLDDGLLHAASRKGTWQYEAIETLLKGKEVTLPGGHTFQDKESIVRHEIRVRWWDRTARSYRTAYMGPEHARTHIPDDEIVGDHLVEYAHDAPPVFIGHYWLEGDPGPLADNIACTDYSVARPGGKLAAYRWSGEARLTGENFVTVDRQEP